MIKVFIVALVFGFLGFLLETFVTSFYSKRFVYAGDKLFWGIPFLPIYSVGGLLMHLCLQSLHTTSSFAAILITWLATCGWEYFAGLFCDKIIGKRFWDYRRHKFNLHGYICITNSLFWLVLVILYKQLFFYPIEIFLAY